MVTLRTLLVALLAPSLILASASAPRPVGPPELVAKKTCTYPAQAINLTNWKLTLPSGTAGNPDSVGQPQLATYRNPSYFSVPTNCNGVTFTAPVNGVTTSGSTYPRSELREMTNNGQANASWSATIGTHTFSVTEAFAHLPSTKPQVVGAQIHDATDDISTFRLEGTKLWVTNGDNSNYYLVTGSYRLGTQFTAGFQVSGGVVKAYYNGRNVVSFPATFAGAYFKAGVYTQANCTNSTPCAATNFGSTNIYSLSVTHNVSVLQQVAGAARNMLGMP